MCVLNTFFFINKREYFKKKIIFYFNFNKIVFIFM